MEYVGMKFCERFHLTPFEYLALPASLVELWSSMAEVEAGIEKANQGRPEI